MNLHRSQIGPTVLRNPSARVSSNQRAVPVKHLAANPLPRFGMKTTALDNASRLPQSVELSGLTAEQATCHLPKLEALSRHAQAAARLSPNYSGRYYGALVVLADGTTGLSTNLEGSRQLTLCDLRLAFGNAKDQWVANQLEHGFFGSDDAPARLPKVKSIYLVNGTAESSQPVPCSDCQEWLNSTFCTPKTEVVSLEKKDPAGSLDQVLIRKRLIQDMLPLHQGRPKPTFKTTQPIKTLSFKPSVAIQGLPVEEAIGEASAKTLLLNAQAAYESNKNLAKASRLATSASVLLMPSGATQTSSRFDWSARLHEAADLQAASHGLRWINQVQNRLRAVTDTPWLPAFIRQPLQNWLAPQSIRAIAYYGDDPNLPPIASLGRIARKHGSANTQIVTVENDRIHIRKLSEFLPELYRAGETG